MSEVGWELQRGFLTSEPPPNRSPQRADTRYLPLLLCNLRRGVSSDNSSNGGDTPAGFYFFFFNIVKINLNNLHKHLSNSV